MKEILREFFGYGGYLREPEGVFSWQHLTFTLSLVAVMIILGIILGLKYKNKTDKEKNKVLIWAALLIDGFELFKLIIFYTRSPEMRTIINNLPLFLCSIQLITIPLAAFSKGRIKEASLDFVFIFGLLGGVLGTVLALQNYACYPVISMDNVISGITHTISGFASLYIGVSGLSSMKKNNMWISFVIISCFAAVAYPVNRIFGTNYMFLMQDDGTPYSIFYNMVNGHKVFYPLVVVGTLLLFICIFYLIFYIVKKKKLNKCN
jgi:uncharacterized membrane protein YwaF